MVDPASDSAFTFQCSIVWKHFESKYCSKSFAYHGGTSNLHAHLKNAHPSVWSTDSGDEEEKMPAVTKSIEFYTTDKSQRVYKSEAIKHLVVYYYRQVTKGL